MSISSEVIVPFQSNGNDKFFFDNLQLLGETFTIQNLSALHKRRILELKENHAYVIHAPTKRNQPKVV